MAVVPARRALALGAALAVLAALAACTPDAPAGAPEAVSVRTTVEQIWATAGLEPVSAVRNIAGVAVVYGTTPDGLVLYGLDPATGTQLWATPAVPPLDDDDAYVQAIDDTLAYYRPTGTDRISTLVLADPHSGADLVVSTPRYWNYYPQECADDDAWVCAMTSVQAPNGDWDRRPFRVNRSSGDTQPEPAPDPPSRATRIHRHGRKRNRQTDRPGDRRRQLRFRSGHGGFAMDRRGHCPRVHGRTLGPELAKGRRHRPASCVPLPLHRNGSLQHVRPRRVSIDTSDLDVMLERFDPVSGVAEWASPLGDARTLAADTSTGAIEALLDDTHLFVSNSTGGVIVDLNSGQTRTAEQSDVLWCTDIRSYPRAEAYFSTDTRMVTTASRSGVFRPCTSTGTDAALPTDSIPAGVSARFGDELRVVSLTTGVSGFLAPSIDGEQTSTSLAKLRGVSEATMIRDAIRAAVWDVRPAPRGGLFTGGEPIAARAEELLEGFGER